MVSELELRATRALEKHFGHTSFLDVQYDIIEHVVTGGDALVIMPTGGGKSLCYQLPALLLDGVTIVLSPLIALMQDQVDALRKKGIAATFINSSLDKGQREERMRKLTRGAYKILYVTPERFRKPEFLEAIEQVEVSLLAVDEAHCITTWGHDFRPEYGRVGLIRERLKKPPTIALTATATPDTQVDILKRLGIDDARFFHTGIDRPNLHIGVHEVYSVDERYDRIVEIIQRLRGPGIVYMTLIRDIRALEDRLIRQGFRPLVYHGDLSALERRQMQRRFIDSTDEIVLATNAFGMGVDKADIRFIIHGQIPGSPESYYQEIGRAGRDGKPSLCELLYFSEELMIQKQFIEWANPTAEFTRRVYDLMESWGENLYAHSAEEIRETLLLKNRHDGRVDMVLGVFRAEGVIDGTFERGNLRIVRPLEGGEEEALVDENKRARDLTRLLDLLEYVQTSDCRRRNLHAYFGFIESEDCGNCDRCRPTEAWLEGFDVIEPARDPSEVEATSHDDGGLVAPVKRGDWLLINRKHHVVVKRVEGTPKGVRIEAESATDLKVRSYDLNRVRWERIS